MAADPYFDGPVRKPPPRGGFRLIELLAVIAIIGLLVALLLPATRSARGAARRAQCVNNLKQIALALHHYAATHGALPPAWTEDPGGRPLHSWRTLILPFLEQQDALYRSIDLAKPWDDPANARALRAMPMVFRCPGADSPPHTTTYLAIVGPRACFHPVRPRRLAEITSDHATTLMLIESGPESAVPWMAPSDAGESLVLGINPATRLDHAGGTNAAFVAGNVQFLGAGLPTAERRSMVAISGHDQRTRGPADAPQHTQEPD